MRKKNYFPNKIRRWPLLLITLMLFSAMRTSAQNLDPYKWKNRLVFLVDDDIASKAMQNQLELFQNAGEEMADRDLILFLVNSTDVFNVKKKKVPISIAELHKVARMASDFKGVLLLGKDGGCKLKKDFQIEPKEIFDLIDGMPMRQYEMKNQQ